MYVILYIIVVPVSRNLSDAYPLFVYVNNLIEWLTNARESPDKLVEASRLVVEKRKKDLEAGNDQVQCFVWFSFAWGCCV